MFTLSTENWLNNIWKHSFEFSSFHTRAHVHTHTHTRAHARTPWHAHIVCVCVCVCVCFHGWHARLRTKCFHVRSYWRLTPSQSVRLPPGKPDKEWKRCGIEAKNWIFFVYMQHSLEELVSSAAYRPPYQRLKCIAEMCCG